ncbi:deoxyribonuclease IV [Parvibacter caecicola]|uniref:Probable endonuclease 4 n=1 Tax=Parvibacter caecicola TaxID=747645 RepID=A0A4T9TDV8_9ACTN|nr:deoxyribonuclease IV [Parvibacter caecicola]
MGCGWKEGNVGEEQLTIGCHLSCSKGYAQMARDAAPIGANTFQFFTRNPRGGKAKPIDSADVALYHQLAAEAGIKRILAHAPYTLNLAAAVPDTRQFAIDTMADDLLRMEATPGQLYNFHPGSHVKQGAEEGVRLIVEGLNRVLAPQQTTTVLLETMAGKGSEVGRSFEELAAIIDGVELSDHLGVCLDTCHIWEGGYDVVEQLDEVLEQFDRIVGLDRLRAVHLNDSKNGIGAAKDRHERIGEGAIGFEALSAITRHPALRHLPFELETPNDTLEGYAAEIAALRAAWK